MADLKLNGITPDCIGSIKLGGIDVQKIYDGSTLVWPFGCDGPYTPVEGQNFRFIAQKNTPPYFGLFDETLTEVNTSYNFADLPNASLTVVAAVSDNFTYMLAAGNSSNEPVQLSTNNGESWNTLPFSSSRIAVHISKSGKTMIIETGNYPSAIIEVSNNFGSSFTTLDLNNVITLGTSIMLIGKMALSSGGEVVLVSVRVNGLYPNNPWRLLKSTNSGASFSDITDTVGFPFTDAATIVNVQDALVSGNGQYQIYFNAYGPSRYSDDYGATFVDKDYQLADWDENGQMSEDGQYFMLNSFLTAGAYSTDFGVSSPLNIIPNAQRYSLGVSNSGQFSLVGSTSGSFASIEYSSDFFNTFTFVPSSSGANIPYLIVDVS